MVEETTFLKQNFKQKENKLLADFLNMKSSKEKAAIGYKNPLCLTHAKQAQPALYNGHEILKDNHARAKVHNSEDTLEIAKLTRMKMNAKMTDPECVTHKVKIAPYDYSKENLLATFTHQKQLTPEQIYWSNDLMKLKSEALKERAKVSRHIKAFTVYPLNTPATLVLRVLSTTRQVKIHIFTLIQQFSEFDKTCKKRITPSVITDRERGFEQTKACYLQEVIPFFQTIKDNFEGIQKALTREVKQMKDVFEELEAKIAQCAVDRKHNAINRKNLLISNDNLIAECLSKETDCLRAENDKVKQHYKQLYDSIKITHAKHIERVTKLTAENVTLKTSVSKAKVQPPVLTRTKHAVYVEPIVPRLRNNREAHLDYLRHLKENVETIRDIIEEAKVKTNVPVPHSTGVKRCPKASGSQPKSNHKTNRISPAKGANKLPVEDLPRTNNSHPRTMNRVDSSSRLKRSVINSNLDSICQTCNKCLTCFDHDMCVAVCVKSVMLPHSTRHNCKVERKIKQVWKPKQVGKVWKPTGKVLTTIGHQWRPTGRILHLGTQCPLTRFTAPQVVVQILLWYLDSGCSKHMTEDRSRLLNFVKKFIETVRFRNDHFGAIMGYGDYVVGESIISRVYYVEGLGHNLFFVGQFCDFNLKLHSESIHAMFEIRMVLISLRALAGQICTLFRLKT
nr:hypothetical protein [Tanacetum cinerariifolium]